MGSTAMTAGMFWTHKRTLWHVLKWRLLAVNMICFVTSLAKHKFVWLSCLLAHLTAATGTTNPRSPVEKIPIVSPLLNALAVILFLAGLTR